MGRFRSFASATGLLIALGTAMLAADEPEPLAIETVAGNGSRCQRRARNRCHFVSSLRPRQ